jgi:Protein of unknown function (DUF2867)
LHKWRNARADQRSIRSFKSQDHDSRAFLDQTAFFAPKGLLGFAYWYALYPIHSMIFGSMIQKLARRAAALRRHALRRHADTIPLPSHHQTNNFIRIGFRGPHFAYFRAPAEHHNPVTDLKDIEQIM